MVVRKYRFWSVSLIAFAFASGCGRQPAQIELDLARVNKIEVFGSPEVTESYEAIDAEALFQVATHRVVFTPADAPWKTRSLVWALRNTRPIPNEGRVPLNSYDYRWGCVLYSRNAVKIHDLYLDWQTNKMVVDGRQYYCGRELRLWFYLVAIGPFGLSGVTVLGCVVLLLFGVILTIFFVWRRKRATRAGPSDG